MQILFIIIIIIIIVIKFSTWFRILGAAWSLVVMVTRCHGQSGTLGKTDAVNQRCVSCSILGTAREVGDLLWTSLIFPCRSFRLEFSAS